jgi:hypothetical protein
MLLVLCKYKVKYQILHFKNIILLPFLYKKLTLLTCYLLATTAFVKLLLRLDPMRKDLKQRCNPSFCKTVLTVLEVCC